MPRSAKAKLPPGFVRGDVVSHAYVPIRTWRPQEGIGILPYLFEYNLMEHRDGVPLEVRFPFFAFRSPPLLCQPTCQAGCGETAGNTAFSAFRIP